MICLYHEISKLQTHLNELFCSISEMIVILTVNFSRYPVILSIENHCNIKQQQAMAAYMTSIFGDKLCQECVGENEDGPPSPESLKGKILVKVMQQAHLLPQLDLLGRVF